MNQSCSNFPRPDLCQRLAQGVDVPTGLGREAAREAGRGSTVFPAVSSKRRSGSHFGSETNKHTKPTNEQTSKQPPANPHFEVKPGHEKRAVDPLEAKARQPLGRPCAPKRHRKRLTQWRKASTFLPHSLAADGHDLNCWTSTLFTSFRFADVREVPYLKRNSQRIAPPCLPKMHHT